MIAYDVDDCGLDRGCGGPVIGLPLRDRATCQQPHRRVVRHGGSCAERQEQQQPLAVGYGGHVVPCGAAGRGRQSPRGRKKAASSLGMRKKLKLSSAGISFDATARPLAHRISIDPMLPAAVAVPADSMNCGAGDDGCAPPPTLREASSASRDGTTLSVKTWAKPPRRALGLGGCGCG